MPIGGSWRSATADRVRLNVPEAPGVYELKAFGQLVYVGRAENLRAALLDHVEDGAANYYRFETPDLMESVEGLYERHLRSYEQRHGDLPPRNDESDAEAART